MLLLIPLVPLIGFLINASLGRRIGRRAAAAVACSAILLSFLLSLAAVWQLMAKPPDARTEIQDAYNWIASGDLSVGLTLLLDPLSSVMILVVTGVGSLIHVYSIAYMADEQDSEYARYFSYLNLFAAFMLLLVLASNFLVMFVGWEGVGLCSYLLIGFWYQKKSATDAGKKAFIVNRIGDFGFVLGMLLTFVRFGTLTFSEIARSLAPIGPEVGFGTVSVIALLLFVGATGKSAQLPLYVWLPDAMEGPTPVSALIHAATMVTAGVYMIGRNAVLFSHAPATLAVVATIGAATAFFAATIGLVQNDIKRVLAYSTVSQLGYMFLAMGVGAFASGIFHLLTHAFFKALLFLGSGAVIHALSGEQDLRRMGGLKNDLPITYWTFLIGALAIAGVPGLSGFFSKDEILFRTIASGHPILWAIGLVTAFLTAIYMFRLVFLAFHGEPAAAADHDPDPQAHRHIHDAPRPMAIALIVLAIGSVFAGYVNVPQLLGGGERLSRFLEPAFGASVATEQGGPGGAVEGFLMLLSSAVALGGIAVSAFLFLWDRRAADALASRFSGIRQLLLNKYYVDEIYDAAIVQPIRIISEEGLWKVIDTRVIDGTVNGVGRFVSGTGELLRRVQTGSVRAYAASLLLGVVVILGYFLWL